MALSFILKPVIRHILLSLSVIFIGLLLTVLTVSMLSLSSKPLLTHDNPLNPEKAKHSKAALKRIYSKMRYYKGLRFVGLSETEIDSVLAIAMRAFPKAKSRVSLESDIASLALTITLPLPEAFRYLNISTTLLSSKDGIQLGDIDIGATTLSGQRALKASIFLADLITEGDFAQRLSDVVKEVQVEQTRIIVKTDYDASLISFNNQKGLLAQIRDRLSLYGDVSKVNVYYEALGRYGLNQVVQKEQQTSSITPFINFIFELVDQRLKGNSVNSVKEENYAALMALSLYFGADQFKLLVGRIPKLNSKARSARYRLRNTVTLRNRVDLQKHFIYSVALQLFSNNDASDAVGELKEFIDTGKGGSGFSFVDLMADRAGTRLALVATQNDQNAKQAIEKLMFITESELLPTIEGLKEGVSAEQFSKTYVDVSSTDYRQAIDQIDSRLETLHLYQGSF